MCFRFGLRVRSIKLSHATCKASKTLGRPPFVGFEACTNGSVCLVMEQKRTAQEGDGQDIVLW